VYDQAADTYALDAEMANKLREANPEAFRNIVGRMLEANGRGFWQPSEEKLEKLRELYELTDEELEGVTIV
jgi:magnesium chelatase subunit H